ncbi:MAG TPA: SRPBCC domain-containing protein [Caulobacteraceae bacterium]|nr:SRPBCC domain-containing protein [Caulobacteraceae bacterium]
MPAAIALEPEEARTIAFVRRLDAPRELVFEVFTTAEHLGRWWGPAGFSVTTYAFEFRAGGVWRFVMHGPDGRDYQNRIVFDVIEPPARIVARHDGGDDVEDARHEMRVTLEALGRQTRLEWSLVFDSIAERDRIAREYGAEQGLIETTGRLADYVAGRAR